jgi:hypothetical protein
VEERENRTIHKIARIMLKDNGFSYELWGEVVTIANYFLNICPKKSICNMISQEAWSNKNPSVEHFSVFWLCHK